MTKREQWLALAERCEKATGPDREIDVAVCLAIDWKTDGTRPLREVVPLYSSVAEFVRSAAAFTSIYSHDEHLPRFTESLDAITALIERELPEMQWLCRPDIKGGFGNLYAKRKVYSDSEPTWPCAAATTALALCAAFCRAMAESARP